MNASDYKAEAETKLDDLNKKLDVNLSDIIKIYVKMLSRVLNFFFA